jgi:hypothetical protein
MEIFPQFSAGNPEAKAGEESVSVICGKGKIYVEIPRVREILLRDSRRRDKYSRGFLRGKY